MITTDTHFITCFENEYNEVESSIHAELLGVVQAMKYVSAHYPKGTQIAVFTDSRTVALKYIQILAAKSVAKNSLYFREYDSLLKLSEGYIINVQHIRGHQDTHNPNKVCDILAKLHSKEL